MIVSGEERREKNNINNRDAREKYNNIFTLLLRFNIAMYAREGMTMECDFTFFSTFILKTLVLCFAIALHQAEKCYSPLKRVHY